MKGWLFNIPGQNLQKQKHISYDDSSKWKDLPIS